MVAEFTKDSLPQAVRALFELNNFTVAGPLQLHGAEIDIVAKNRSDPFSAPIYLEVTTEYVDNDKYGKDVGKLAMIGELEPGARRVIVSSSGFSLPVVERAKATRIDTYTYDALFSLFEQFDPYVKLILEDERIGSELRHLADIYEEPFFRDKLGTDKATQFLDAWKNSAREAGRWLIVLGEYGTGKTALTKVLQYRWLQAYRHNPKLPIPFRIELRDLTRQFDARGLLHHFLDYNGLGHVPIDFVFSLIRSGRVVLLLDGYDEMAQYMLARERRVCLEALASLSGDGARGILTSRPNYFTDTEEFQVFEILYSALRHDERGTPMARATEDAIRREKEIDELITTHFLERFERTLEDLSAEQTEALVRRVLCNDQEGCSVVLSLMRRIQRSSEDGGAISLSGKPVIITYLLDIVESLKERARQSEPVTEKRGTDQLFPVSEWSIYKLIIDQLMYRDLRRSPLIAPDRRRHFLQVLSVWLSRRDNPVIDEVEFVDLIRRVFAVELRSRISSSEKEEEADRYFKDLRSSTTLTRSADRTRVGWRFSHNSLREYLLCEYMVDGLSRGELVDDEVPVSEAMRTFVASREDAEITALVTRLSTAWSDRKAHRTVGNYLSLLWSGMLRQFISEEDPGRAILNSVCKGRAVLDGVSLRGIRFSSEQQPMDLDRAPFVGSVLVDVDISGARLRHADFTGCMLDNVKFQGSDLSEAVFFGSSLIDVDIEGTRIKGADFRGVVEGSTILVGDGDATRETRRLGGRAAIGYLRYQGAVTEPVPSYFVYRNHPRFGIVEKICRRLSEQVLRQERGLVQRGVAHQDPLFAGKFVQYLNRVGLVEKRYGGRRGMVEVTRKGREVFGGLFEKETLAPEMEKFFEDNPV